MSPAAPEKMKAKVCLVGEMAVGKTSLVRRFVHEEFDDRYIATIGTKVSKREVVVTPTGQTQSLRVNLAVWDIMGDHGFRDMLRDVYLLGARGVLAVSDLTRPETLADLGEWIEMVRKVAGNVDLVLLGNKADLEGQSAITEADLARAAAEFRAPYFVTSAKTGDSVSAAFERLATALAERQLWSDGLLDLLPEKE